MIRSPTLAAASLAFAVPLASCMAAGEPVATAPATPADPLGAQADALLARMSMERKVAQLVMPDINSITPDDVRTYRFGSILNGGNSGPGGDDKAAAPKWLALADAYWEASSAPHANGEPAIPALWATDAVHGHSNIPGATIFPHNIGLGATRDAELMRRIGEVTAAEIAVTGIDWTFAPTLAVATDDRWGRTYESFSEDPQLVARLGEAQVVGLQGTPGTAEFLSERHVIATAKHFFGDGGTGGKDRGDTRGDLAELKRVHAAPYPPAFQAGVQTLMASFSSVNGDKMHGSKPLLTDYLRGELGFEGLVVGDWNGHGELAACSNTDCPQSLLAGLDIYMVPEDWKGLYANLLAQVEDGTIPMERLDQAVHRILRVKLAYGLMDKPKPSERVLAGQWSQLGSADHRAVAREAVRKSLVLLKNDGVLPLKANARVLVAGQAANDVAWQSGGWSITWQGGGDLTNADFPGATSIFRGIENALATAGGTAVLSPRGDLPAAPVDAAVIVFGEQPYAEFVGDRDDLAFRDEEGLELLRKFKAQGIPTVAVFLSGRPMWTARELGLADAFVAAWLPGSEGQGVSDVIIGDAAGVPRHDFTGKLAFGWPGGCAPHGSVAFPFGFGGSYALPPRLPELDADCALLNPDLSQGLAIFGRGLSPAVRASAGDASLTNLVGTAGDGSVTVRAFDIAAQEDGRRVAWRKAGTLAFEWGQRDLPQGGELVLRYRADAVPQGRLALVALGTGQTIDLTPSFTLGAGKGWRNLRIPLACLNGKPAGFALESAAAYEFELDTLNITPQAAGEDCTGPF